MHFCFEEILLLSKSANFLPSIVSQQSEIPMKDLIKEDYW